MSVLTYWQVVQMGENWQKTRQEKAKKWIDKNKTSEQKKQRNGMLP